METYPEIGQKLDALIEQQEFQDTINLRGWI
jgi:hypothetical protein